MVPPYLVLSLVRHRIHAVRQSTRLLEVFGVVQTVRITVESPQFALPFSVSVHGCLSSGNGFSDDMDYLHFWRR